MDSKTASEASGDQGNSGGIVLHLRKPTVFWAILLAYSAYAIHQFGRSGQQSYLNDFDAHNGMFEKSMDWLMATGFDALGNRMIWMFEGITKHGVAMALVAAFCGALFFVYRRLTRLKAFNEKKDRLAHWRPVYKDAVESLLVMMIAFAGVPLVITLVALLIVVPMAIGSAYGHAVASHQKQIFDQGCDSAPSPYKCVALLDENNKQLSKGFIIESSDSQIAIYDTTLKTGLVYELSGKQLVGQMPTSTAQLATIKQAAP